MALFSGQVEAGGETVRLCLSWMPSTGGKVTPCGVSEDLRWSRVAMSNLSMRPRGSTIKTCSEATPFSPPPLPEWSKLPLSLAWMPVSPFQPWLPSASSHHGRHWDPINKHGGPCPHSVQNGPELHGHQTTLCLPTLLSRVHCSYCAPVQCCAVLSPSIVSESFRLHGLPPGSSVHGIPQTRIMEWVAISFSRGSSGPGTKPSSLAPPTLAGGFFTTTPPGKPLMVTLMWGKPESCWEGIL